MKQPVIPIVLLIILFLLRNNDLLAHDTQPSDSLSITTAYIKGEQYLRKNLDSARLYLETAISKAQRHNFPVLESYAKQRLARFFVIKGDYDSAIAILKNVEAVFREENDFKGRATVCLQQGGILFRKGDFVKAIDRYRESQYFFRSIGDSVGISNGYNNIGNCFGRVGDYTTAIEYHYKGLLLRQKAGYKALESASYNNLSQDYYYTGDLEKSEELIRKSLDIKKELGNEISYFNSLNNLAKIQLETDRLEESLKNSLIAFENGERLQDYQITNTALLILASINSKKNNHGTAIEYLNMAEDNVSADLNKFLYAEILDEQAKSLHALQRYSAATAKAKELVEISEEMPANELVINAYRMLSEISESQGRIKDAFAYYKEMVDLEHKVNEKAKNAEIENLEAKFQLRKALEENESLTNDLSANQKLLAARKEAELLMIIVIVFLLVTILISWKYYRSVRTKNNKLSEQFDIIRSSNNKLKELSEDLSSHRDELKEANNKLLHSRAIVKAYNEELKREVDDKTQELNERNKQLEIKLFQLERYSRITAHNLRSPVSKILGFAKWIERGEYEKEELVELCSKLLVSAEELDETIHDIIRVLRADTEKNIEFEEVCPKEVVLNVLMKMERQIIDKGINVITHLDAEFIYSEKHLLGQIIYMILENSVYYSSSNLKPEIKIRSYLNDKKYILLFEDSGQGFDSQSVQDRLFEPFQRFTKQGKSRKGIGLFLIRSMVEGLGGTILLRSRKDKGTFISLEFPILDAVGRNIGGGESKSLNVAG